MKPINIYALTRIENPASLSRLERQMSERERPLKIRLSEIEGLRSFLRRLGALLPELPEYTFFYSFSMPKIGKEFDLLRIDRRSALNIELKSSAVPEEAIKKQLVQNRYYLATLGKTMYSYTYVSGEDRLLRLTRGGRLVDAAWEEIKEILTHQSEVYEGHIEELFREESFLISPLTDTDKFLRGEYFLTSQQNDIKKKVLKSIRESEKSAPPVQGFTGLPGTGKTILLYDIAMCLSRYEKVCVLHFGSHVKELQQLNERLKRIDFYYMRERETLALPREYRAILVDEGHRLSAQALSDIMSCSQNWQAPVIFSYDNESVISPRERQKNGADRIEALPGYLKYRLTNRIRLNSVLSAFIGNAVCLNGKSHRHEYPGVSLTFANNDDETRQLLQIYAHRGYVYISDVFSEEVLGALPITDAAGKEFEKVVMVMDRHFFYDADGFLRYENPKKVRGDSPVRNLFHGLSRAKKKIAVIVKENTAVFEILLYLIRR